MLKTVKIAFLILLINAFVSICLCNDTAASEFPEKERHDFLTGCIQRGLQRGDNQDYVEKFCKCSWEVQCNNMTYEEYVEMTHLIKQGKNPEEIPQLMRIWDKLNGCKNK